MTSKGVARLLFHVDDPSRKKLRIGVIYGGRSGEHEVSLASAASVIATSIASRYEPVPILIDKDGRWTLPDRPPTAVSAADVIARVRSAGGRDRGARSREVHLVPYPADETMLTIERSTAPTTSRENACVTGLALDVVFPVLHGPYGEDGTVQGLLELANVPYVGAGVLASAVGMDKAVMKMVFAARGLPVVDHVVMLASEWAADPRGVSRGDRGQRSAYPVFVKPANLGSSVGISKVKAPGDLAAADRRSRSQFDRKIDRRGGGADGARDRVRGPRQRRPGGVGPRRDPAVARVLRLRSEVPRRGVARCDSRAVCPRPTRRASGRWRSQAFRAIDGAGMARVDFLLAAESGELYRQRDQHHPGLHDDQHVPEAVGGDRPRLPGAARSARSTLALERHAAKQRLRTSVT